MRKRPLGSTGIEVSEFALGTWGLSGDGYGPVPESEQDAVIDRALALGVTLFETADSYAKGEMERRLGRLLPKEDVTVVTKIGTSREESPARKRFDAQFLKDAAEASRERLGRDRIDVVLLHNPSAATLRSGEVQPAMAAIVEAGIARTWGISVGGDAACGAALTCEAPVIQVPYNVFYRRDFERVAFEAKEKKIGILARSVLAYGLLCGNWPTTKEFPSDDHRSERWNPDELKRRIMQLNALRPSVAGHINSLRAVAVRYVLSKEVVSSAVLGPRKSAQLDQLVRDAGNEDYYMTDYARTSLDNRVLAAGVKT
jgi:aryl-alcohol dehydrogenase-like predicted oxidoreductase